MGLRTLVFFLALGTLSMATSEATAQSLADLWNAAKNWFSNDNGPQTKQSTTSHLTLLVTWFVHDQPPSSYQASFYSVQTCEDARNKILADEARLQAQIKANDQQRCNAVRMLLCPETPAPRVTAVCAEQ